MAEKKIPKKAAAASTSTAEPGSPMDPGLLAQIVELMASNDLNTVDLRDGDRRVVLRRGPAVVQMAGMPMAAAAPAYAAPAAAPAASGASAGTPAPAAADEESKYTPIKSPMVGTFYASPKPGEKPFVNVGSVVNEDSDVCIIEAMKTFNLHKAGCSGTIVKVLATDGQPVQFDQTLFLVKPS